MEVINAIGRRKSSVAEGIRDLFPLSHPAVCGEAATEPVGVR